MEWAKNKPGHGEEQSDVAIQLEIQMDCRARRPGLAMTNHGVTTAIQMVESLTTHFH